jgi:hypothetical protein
MSDPGPPIGESALFMFSQAGDDRSSKRVGAHVGESILIDHVIASPGAQQFEEVEAAL